MGRKELRGPTFEGRGLKWVRVGEMGEWRIEEGE